MEILFTLQLGEFKSGKDLIMFMSVGGDCEFCTNGDNRGTAKASFFLNNIVACIADSLTK